jgi:hypothetical protein
VGVLLVVGMCFLLVMALMGVAQSFFAGQVTDAASRTTLGRMALMVAESAVAEASMVMSRRANEPGEIYRALREAARRGSSTGASLASVHLDLQRDLPRTAGLLATKALDRFELVGGTVDVKLSYGRALLPIRGDYEAVAELACRVRFKLDRAVVRGVRQTVVLKVNRVALPPPLGTLGVVVKTPLRLAKGAAPGDEAMGVDVNDLVTKLLDGQLPRIRAAHQQTMSKLNDAKAREDPFVKQVRPYYARIDGEGGGPDFIGEVEAYRYSLVPYPPMPGQPGDTVAITRSRRGNLDTINLQGALMPLRDMLLVTMEKCEAVHRELEVVTRQHDPKAGSIDPRLTKLNQDHALLTTRFLVEMGDLLGCVKRFQTAVRFIRKTSTSGSEADLFRVLRALFAQVEAEQLAGALSFWGERATFVVSEDPRDGDVHVKIGEQLAELLRKLSVGERGPNAIVLVDNPNEVLTLKGEFSGKLVLCIRGSCRIDGVRAKGTDDVLTIVANGGPAGAIAVKGNILASLVLNGLKLAIDPETTIVGTVMVGDLSVAHAAEIGGRVVADPRLADTDADPFWTVSMSPWSRTRVVERS